MVTGVFPPPLFAVTDGHNQPLLHPHPKKDLLSSSPSSSLHNSDPSLSSCPPRKTPATPSSPVFSPPISPLYTSQVYNHHQNLYSRFKVVGSSDTQQQRDRLYKTEDIASSSCSTSPSSSHTRSHSIHSTVQDHPSYSQKHIPQSASNKYEQQYTTLAQQFHHPQQKPSHGCHPLNRPAVVQQRLLANPPAIAVSIRKPTLTVTKAPTPLTSSPNSAPAIVSTTPMHIWEQPQERKFVLSSPPGFPPRGRKSSVDSISSVHSTHSAHSVGSIVKNSPFLQQEQKQQQQQQQQPSPSFLKHHRKRSSTQGELALVMSMGQKIQNQLASPSVSPSMSPLPGRYQLTRRLSELAPVKEHFAEEFRELATTLSKELPKELPKEMPTEVLKEQPSEAPLATPPNATDNGAGYQTLLAQIAAQRAKLQVLQTGTEALTNDIAVLDETLDEAQESMDRIVTTAQRAVHGWEGVWSDYAKCEPVEALQTRPGTLADLIHGMKWQEKKALFEAMVVACKPRETFQLQNLISVNHGPVNGFDLLQELPSNVSKLVMQYLSFAELANCRMVSKSWKQKATSYEVVANALSRLTQSEDSFPLEQQDHSTSNWNQLCRFHERDLRWRRGKPASIHAMLGHSTYVTSVKDRGEWIVSGGYDEKVRLWESSTGKCVKIWEVGSAVSCVEMFVDRGMEGGGVVVAAFVDIGLLKVWSLHGPLNMHTLTGHQKGVRALAISDRYLVTAGFDQTVLVWNWNTGRKIASFRAHNEVILSVHLTKNTVYSFCIDATLRAFDITSRTLLHQVKLLDLQPNSTLQWSCLQENMFLTATNKKVYVWHMEHLESLVLQQNQLQQQAFHLQIGRPKSAMSASSDSSSNSGSNNSQDSCETHSPPQTLAASASFSSLNTMISAPDTPALSIDASSSCSSTGSSYFYPSVSTMSLPLLPNTEPLCPGDFGMLETRVQPRLTAVLNMNMDMWCGNVTRHDPPLLVLGSRSSTIKLVTISLTKDIIDPNKDYEANYVPLQVFPKPSPVQGMPDGNGRGIMCIDTDSNRLVVGCTGGAIHVMNMDPSMRALQPLRASQAHVAIVTLPHLTPNPVEPVLSNSSFVHVPGTTVSGLFPTAAIPHSAASVFPRRQPVVIRSNATNGMASRLNFPSPDQSPMTIPLILSASTIPVSEPVNPCPRSATKPSLPMGSTDLHPYEDRQEVLVADEDDEDVVRERLLRNQVIRARQHDLALVSAEVRGVPTSSTVSQTSKKATASATSSVSKKSGVSLSSSPPRSTSQPKISSKPFLLTTTGSSSLSSSSSSSSLSSSLSAVPITSGSQQPSLSGLSKYIPSPPSRIMMRRRASSNVCVKQSPKSNDGASSPNGNCMSAASLMMRGRNRSNPDLLSSAHSSGVFAGTATAPSSPMPSVSISTPSSSMPKNLAKSWTLSSPWNSPSKRSTKNK